MISILHVPRTLITYFSGNKLLKKKCTCVKKLYSGLCFLPKIPDQHVLLLLLLLLILLFSVKFIVLAG